MPQLLRAPREQEGSHSQRVSFPSQDSSGGDCLANSTSTKPESFPQRNKRLGRQNEDKHYPEGPGVPGWVQPISHSGGAVSHKHGHCVGLVGQDGIPWPGKVVLWLSGSIAQLPVCCRLIPLGSTAWQCPHCLGSQLLHGPKCSPSGTRTAKRLWKHP